MKKILRFITAFIFCISASFFTGCANMFNDMFKMSPEVTQTDSFYEYKFLPSENTLYINSLNTSDGENTIQSDFSISGAGSTAKKIVLGTDVTVIPDYAFENCKNLTELELQENITQTGSHIFGYNNNSVFIKNGEKLLNASKAEDWIDDSTCCYVIDGTLYFKGSGTLSTKSKSIWANKTGVSKLILDVDNIIIPDYMFDTTAATDSPSNFFTAITLPQNIQDLGCRTFGGQTEVSEISIPESYFESYYTIAYFYMSYPATNEYGEVVFVNTPVEYFTIRDTNNGMDCFYGWTENQTVNCGVSSLDYFNDTTRSAIENMMKSSGAVFKLSDGRQIFYEEGVAYVNETGTSYGYPTDTDSGDSTGSSTDNQDDDYYTE